MLKGLIKLVRIWALVAALLVTSTFGSASAQGTPFQYCALSYEIQGGLKFIVRIGELEVKSPLGNYYPGFDPVRSDSGVIYSYPFISNGLRDTITLHRKLSFKKEADFEVGVDISIPGYARDSMAMAHAKLLMNGGSIVPETEFGSEARAYFIVELWDEAETRVIQSIDTAICYRNQDGVLRYETSFNRGSRVSFRAPDKSKGKSVSIRLRPVWAIEPATIVTGTVQVYEADGRTIGSPCGIQQDNCDPACPY